MGNGAALNTALKKGAEKHLPDVSVYTSLRQEVRKALDMGRQRAQEALEREKTRTYWNVGRLIDAHVFGSDERGDYGKRVVKKLAEDLGTNQTLLYYALQFARTYAELPDKEILSWSHYKALLPVKDESQRRRLEAQALHEGWSSRELEGAAQGVSKMPPSRQRPGFLPRAPRRFFTYRIARISGAGGARGVDLGFGILVELGPKEKKFFEGDLVTLSMTPGSGTRHFVRGVNLDQEDLYIYRGKVERIESADCLGLQLEIGNGIFLKREFGLWGFSRISTDKASGLKERIKRTLKIGETVTVKTHKSPKGIYTAIVYNGGPLSVNEQLLKASS